MTLPATSLIAQRLPTPRMPLIGRRREVATVTALLRDPDVRMVTITGPGGAGKTRLGLEIAHLLADSFRDGAWFIPLAAIREESLVIPTIAQVLGVRDIGELPVAPRLHQRLRSDDVLLMLDNLEQVRDVGPELGRLLQACPGVTLLVTSRTVLHLTFEHAYPIAGLPLPSEHHGSDLARLAHNDAIHLFVAHVQSRDRSFRLDHRNAGPIVEICRRLDGLPLGIDLAAARIPALSPDALYAQLSHRLTNLKGEEYDRPQRHRALMDTVDWSIQLMAPEERTAFLRLAVLAGPFTAPMAAALLQDPPGADEVGPVTPSDEALDATYDLLGSLVDQSLVRPMTGTGSEPRFRLLQTIREVALEHLVASGEEPRARRRHALACLAFAEQAAAHLTGPDQARWLESLERGLDDFRAAMAWFRTTDQHGELLRLATALWRLGYTRGHLGEARTWLHEALAQTEDATPTRVEALNALGLLASTQGDPDVAVHCHVAALAMARDIGDRRGAAAALNGLGDAATVAGDRGTAHERYDEALSLYRAIGDRRGIAGVLTNLGNLAWDERELDVAVTLHGQALAVFREIDERRGIAWAVTNLGTLAAEQGAPDRARALLREAHALYEELGDATGVIVTLEGFAEIAHAEAQPNLEATLRAAASSVRDKIGAPIAPGIRDWYDQNLDRIRTGVGASFHRVWAEGRAMTPDAAIAMALEPGGPPLVPSAVAVHGLSPREIEIVRLIAEGRTNQQIAGELSIGVRTVDTHVAHIFRKLEVPTRSAIAALARREGLV